MMARYLTRLGEYEVGGSLVTLDVQAEVKAQIDLLREHNVTPTVILLSEDAYGVFYLQMCEQRRHMDLSIPDTISDFMGYPIRRKDEPGTVLVLAEAMYPHGKGKTR